MCASMSTLEYELVTNGVTVPYSPSWLDRFHRWVDHLPIPDWLFYTGLGLCLLILDTLARWHDGTIPVGTVHPFRVVATAVIPYALGFMHWLDRDSRRVLARVHPDLTLAMPDSLLLRYQIA